MFAVYIWLYCNNECNISILITAPWKAALVDGITVFKEYIMELGI